ncbi:MAG: hypothetical protein Q8R56_04620 [Polaromonas sp.]|nr:hypothetical protein [Polaromonas sp.]
MPVLVGLEAFFYAENDFESGVQHQQPRLRIEVRLAGHFCFGFKHKNWLNLNFGGRYKLHFL